MIGFTAYFENGTIDTAFDPLNNDYIDVVTSFWDTATNIKEGKDYLYLSDGPKIRNCGLEKVTELVGANIAYMR